MGPLTDLTAASIPSGSILEAVPRQLFPAINTIHAALRGLDRRIGRLEAAQSGPAAPCECAEVESLREEIDALRAALRASRAPSDVLPTRVADTLRQWGLETGEHLRMTPDEDLLAIEGIGQSRLEDIRDHFPFDPDA